MFAELLLFVSILLCYFYYQTQRRPKNFPPGPNGLPIFGYMAFLQQFEVSLAKISEKYGSIYSIFLANQLTVIISDVSIMREILKDDRFLDRPLLKPFIDRSWGKPKGIIFANGKKWAEQRRFTLKNLRNLGLGRGSMENLIMDEAVDVIAQFKRTLGEPVSVDSIFRIAGLNSIWHIIAGERYAHDDPRLLQVISTVTSAINEPPMAGPLFFNDWLTNAFPNWSGYSKFISGYRTTIDFLQEFVDLHRKTIDPNNPRDFIDSYLQEIENTTDPESSFFGQEGIQSLTIVILDMFTAGADTISNTLSWSFLLLIRNPEIQEKLYMEIIKVVGKERLPALSDRQSMNYMEAFIAEMLRVTTITPTAGRNATEDLEFHGYSIPKGTLFVGNYWQMHNDPKNWPNPEKFQPERFLSPEGKYIKNENLISFSIGKRACLGEGLAKDYIFLFLSSILQSLKLEMDYSSPPPSLVGCAGSITNRSKPFKLIMSLRT